MGSDWAGLHLKRVFSRELFASFRCQLTLGRAVLLGAASL